MSRGLNKVMLMGHVGGEPEIRTTQSGQRVAKFSLATNEQWTDRSGQKQDRVEWHRCTVWGKLAEIIEQHVHKGDKIYVEGKIAYSQTEDEGGKPRYWTEIVVRELIMLSGGGGPSTNRYRDDRDDDDIPGSEMYRGTERRQRQPSSRAPSPTSGSPFDNDDDDLPFNYGNRSKSGQRPDRFPRRMARRSFAERN